MKNRWPRCYKPVTQRKSGQNHRKFVKEPLALQMEGGWHLQMFKSDDFAHIFYPPKKQSVQFSVGLG